MLNQILTCLFLICILASCNDNVTVTPQNEEKNQIDNGKYCAQVNYYNPKTNKHSEYQLYVFIEDNKLTKIYWPNGGWLDQSHFKPQPIEDNKTFFVNDNGYEYEIELLESDDLCEICLLEFDEMNYHDSVMKSIENKQKQVTEEYQQFERELKNSGSRVIYTGCKDLFILEDNNKYVVAQKIGYGLIINVGDRLDCQISKTGLTSVGNLTQHCAGNIKVLSINNTRKDANDFEDQFCSEYMKTWSFN